MINDKTLIYTLMEMFLPIVGHLNVYLEILILTDILHTYEYKFNMSLLFLI